MADPGPCLLGSEERHSTGLDAIFQVEKGSPWHGRRGAGLGAAKIVVWKTRALCATVGLKQSEV